MKKTLSSFLCGALLAGTLVFVFTNSPIQASDHPRIDAAIEKLQDAIVYLKASRYNFGGHKAKAIADCEKAVKQLKKAIEYRTKI
jgi:hypothetical protein